MNKPPARAGGKPRGYLHRNVWVALIFYEQEEIYENQRFGS
nr:MAG TPA: hypothetical protein [Caudoviricetes sp.]